MDRTYDKSKIFRILKSMQDDLKSNKLSEDEFSFLVGLLLESEVQNIVHEYVENFIDKDEYDNSISFCKYEINRPILTHA